MRDRKGKALIWIFNTSSEFQSIFFKRYLEKWVIEIVGEGNTASVGREQREGRIGHWADEGRGMMMVVLFVTSPFYIPNEALWGSYKNTRSTSSRRADKSSDSLRHVGHRAGQNQNKKKRVFAEDTDDSFHHFGFFFLNLFLLSVSFVL